MRTDIKFTYEEYRALPETGPHYQLVDGDLLRSPSPTLRHQLVGMRLANGLFNHVEEEKAGTVLCAPLDLILSDTDVFQPDIVFISNARKKIMVPEGLRGVPDLCVEVLSPSTKNLDFKTKRLLYAHYGLPELWIVDPFANTVRVFRLQEDPHRAAAIYRAADVLTTTLLPRFSLSLSKVFAK